MEKSILVLCGDARSDALFALLQQQGSPARRQRTTAGPRADETIRQAETIVLPTPVTRGSALTGDSAGTPWEAVFSRFDTATRIFGGSFLPAQRALLQTSGIEAVDFLEDECFVRYNAALTAQGALRMLLEETQTLLVGKRVLVTGFGRVGKAVTRLLCAVGCRCFAAARSPLQRREALLLGCEAGTINALDETLPVFDIICNTVPAPLFSAQSLSRCKPGCVYLELASAPFGAKKEACAAAGLRHLDGKGLPGRFLPLSAAEGMLWCLNGT